MDNKDTGIFVRCFLIPRCVCESVALVNALYSQITQNGSRPFVRAFGRVVMAESRAGVCVSVSHDRDVTLIAFGAGGALGVDIEFIRSIPARRLAERYFSELDIARLGASRDLDADFMSLWTLKEAQGKMTGEGLLHGALRWTPPIMDRTLVNGEFQVQERAGVTYSTMIYNNYALAVAQSEAAGSPPVRLEVIHQFSHGAVHS